MAFGRPISPAALKFSGDSGGPDSPHRGDLQWPGTPEGFPFRGPAQLHNAAELSALKHVFDFQSRLFRLYIPDEKTAFDEIMDRAVNGWYVVRRRVDRWSDEHMGLVVWLEWLQVYGHLPTNTPATDGPHVPVPAATAGIAPAAP